MATEKRLIDANALITKIQGTASEVAKNAPYVPEWFTRLAARQFEILNLIDDMPTVDAVEVVRCKGCFYNDKLCPAGFVDRDDDDFCSLGTPIKHIKTKE